MSSTLARMKQEQARFHDALRDARGEQDRLLRQIVSANQDTELGRAHGFSKIQTKRDYLRAVPVRSYEQLLPWLTRTIDGERGDGERGVLTTDPAKLCLSTTGSTGDPKIFPVNQSYLERAAKNTMVWWAALIDRFPAMLERDDTLVALHLVPRGYAEWTSGKLPLHRLSHMAPTVKGALPFTRAPWYPPPADIDYADLTYYFLRSAIEHPLRGFLCLHSSRLTGVAHALVAHASRLVRELHDGTRSGTAHAAPNPARAREIEALAVTGTLTPHRVWPTLDFVTAWRGGTYDLASHEIASKFGVPAFPAPCISTEAGHLTMPVDLASDGPLTIQTNYYEFRPAGATGEHDETLGFDDLEVGRTYEMIFTSPSGLYRYSCGDLFRVVGHVERVPRLEFVARTGAVDLTGEKLSEEQAQTALDHVLAATGLHVACATICPTWGSPPCYTAVFEPSAPWSEDQCTDLARRLDRFLHAQNSRYAGKRDWQELGPLEVRTVRAGTFARFLDRMVAQGRPLPSAKARPLQAELDALAAYLELDR